VSVDSIAASSALATLLTGREKPPAGLAAPQPSWLKELRAEAVERVGALKLPTSNDEAWRFSGIAALAQQSFHPGAAPAALQPADIERFRIDEAAIRQRSIVCGQCRCGWQRPPRPAQPPEQAHAPPSWGHLNEDH